MCEAAGSHSHDSEHSVMNAAAGSSTSSAALGAEPGCSGGGGVKAGAHERDRPHRQGDGGRIGRSWEAVPSARSVTIGCAPEILLETWHAGNGVVPHHRTAALHNV